MVQDLSVLQKSPLFGTINTHDIKKMMENAPTRIVTFSKDALIAEEGENCDRLGIILSGEIEIQKIYASGKTVTMAHFKEGNIFGEALIFSKVHLYPGTVVSRTPAQILFLQKSTIISLCRKHPEFLENFLSLLSERILMLNKKIKELSMGTIRQKIAYFLLEEYEKQGNLTIKLPFSKEIIAEHMGIQRPSLSRELVNMREEGWIDMEKNIIHIKDLQQLTDFLLD
ncbi:MAG: Crp/Fnr family transcriptional regulator [Dehalobacterium sp.]|jgi:CRP-like cAMP-binding protein